MGGGRAVSGCPSPGWGAGVTAGQGIPGSHAPPAGQHPQEEPRGQAGIPTRGPVRRSRALTLALWVQTGMAMQREIHGCYFPAPEPDGEATGTAELHAYKHAGEGSEDALVLGSPGQ